MKEYDKYSHEFFNLIQRTGQSDFKSSRGRFKPAYGRVPFSDLVPGYQGTSCNPAGQAKYLEEHNTWRFFNKPDSCRY